MAFRVGDRVQVKEHGGRWSKGVYTVLKVEPASPGGFQQDNVWINILPESAGGEGDHDELPADMLRPAGGG